MKLNNKYTLEQKVFLITDPEQYERMVTVVSISLSGAITYSLACGADEPTEHFEQEISETKNVF